MFLRSGLIGLASLLGLYGTAIVRFARAARRSVPSPPSTFDMPTLWTLLLLEAVWYTAWPPHQLQGVVLGVAIAILGRSRAALVPSQQPLIPAA